VLFRSPRFDAGTCPDAEELYDYGHGPGARPLDEARRKALDAHLLACGECRDLVTTLASRPPAPLLFDYTPRASDDSARLAATPEPASAEPDRPALSSPVRRPRLLRRYVALAAAAVALLALGLWWQRSDAFGRGPGARGALGVFPSDETLRGDDGGALEFPRGALLAREGRPWHDVEFVLDPRERASAYRFALLARDETELGSGREVARWESAGPESSLAGARVAPGRYTWEGWAVVDGLDVFLGRRDFQVRADAELERALAAALERAGDERAREVLSLLHSRGFFGDARAFARTLPESPERDAYLARKRGR
jgi:hypothetical protein